MKKILSFMCLAILGLQVTAQDTTTVQTLEFSDITKRRGWYVFPSDTGGVRKVTMKYTLKCDPQTTQDGFDCGEWDYTTLCNLYEYKNISAPYFNMNGQTTDTLFYTNNTPYDYYQSYDYFPVYSSTTNENDFSLVAGALTNQEVFQTQYLNNRAQYIFTASELISAGVTAGDIHKLKLDITALGGTLENFTIGMKNTSLTSITPTSYEFQGLTNVYHGNTTLTAGVFTFNLSVPFNWDGISNVIVDFSYTNNNYPTTSNSDHLAESSGFNSGIYTSGTNGYLDFSEPEYVRVPDAAFTAVDSFVTISFWANGDENAMPTSTYAFEGKDINNVRVLNAHLPWSNSRIYWDAGNSGTTTYDRIDKLATFNEFAGQWNHYAFVKDVSTSVMQIYINGALWHSATGKTRTMAGITQFLIGGRADQDGKYEGAIDEFRIWNVALSATEIQDYMYQSVDASHPQYSHLMAAYNFDAVNNLTVADYSGNNHTGVLMGAPQYFLHNGEDLSFNMTQSTVRPNMTFVQGTYVMTVDSTLVIDSIAANTNTIVEQSLSRNLAGSGLLYTGIDTVQAFQANYYTYTYDENGNAIDSIWVNHSGYHVNTLEINTHQIQNYVTPYGIGIDLGPDGFRWEYEVTDYIPVLSDTVEIAAGNQQELIDLKFEYISGTPPRDVVDFESIWTGNYQHANIANDVSMPAVNLDMNAAATQFSLKTRATGHWFGGFENCAEFCPKKHNIAIDGNQEFEWTVWKDCASNPIIDQGGTWIYDRAGWCPGTFANTYNYDITPLVTPGTSSTIDYGMETTAGGMEGNYWVALQLVSYGDHNHQTDAEVLQIVAPNNWEYFNRSNPICSQPVIQIRNLGSDSLTSLDIAYRLKGGVERIYTWTGNLAFMENEEVELDHQDLWWWSQHDGSSMFEVELRNPNGTADENPDNDILSTKYEAPVQIPNHFYFWMQGNNAASETSYRLKDWQGNVIFERNNWTNLTVYRDTFLLADGCYTLELEDSDEDGLSFFANNDGNGFFRYRPVTSGSITTLEPNFGDKMVLHFTVGGVLDIDENTANAYLNIAPNPSLGQFNLEAEGFNGDTRIDVFDYTGKKVYTETVNNVIGGFNRSMNLENLVAGVYIVQITDGEHRGTQRIVIE